MCAYQRPWPGCCAPDYPWCNRRRWPKGKVSALRSDSRFQLAEGLTGNPTNSARRGPIVLRRDGLAFEVPVRRHGTLLQLDQISSVGIKTSLEERLSAAPFDQRFCSRGPSGEARTEFVHRRAPEPDFIDGKITHQRGDRGVGGIDVEVDRVPPPG